MMREIAGVLKLAAMGPLPASSLPANVNAVRRRDRPFSFRIPAILNFGAVKTPSRGWNQTSWRASHS